MAIYVDDGIMIGSNKEEMERVVRKLGEQFGTKKENKPSSFLGFTDRVLEKYGIKNAKPRDTPCEKDGETIEEDNEHKM